MRKILRTQINHDGSVSIWNSLSSKKGMQYYIIQNPEGISKEKLDNLNKLRDFNRMSDRAKLIAKDANILKHEPGKKGNCLSI